MPDQNFGQSIDSRLALGAGLRNELYEGDAIWLRRYLCYSKKTTPFLKVVVFDGH